MFAYLTAAVMANGMVRFADDIYGHDARLGADYTAPSRAIPGSSSSGIGGATNSRRHALAM